ncbi:nuclear factor of activated T-cells 5 [Hemiscyllium ocellatum]|uniref:nuclear factor of activated T-cells 5 n=1 Tax=Hemiscyllium ocellatum TaxID=170820 RepID=UPI0029671ED7|nr:nuclear factor of activated T-cells 5 [Hemiscyllium ocellatum]XP_060693997.1 nuclear factor of activated T-cells 5 [Hemiscyllium ocellatum]XP_060693999.1 nuclear factor of activated T-cells 5 [Hemiscyllium ocellatum]
MIKTSGEWKPHAVMPSDFISLLSADLDLNSPKSLYSKESVYDLLPKELQLPTSEISIASMSQKSGGEATSPPSAAVAPDVSSSGGQSSTFTPSSNPSMHSTSVTDNTSMQVDSCTPEQGVSGHGVSELLSYENQLSNAPQLQSMPKRRTVLNISPPPEDLLDDSRMSCQDDGGDSEQSSNIWMEESGSNFSIMSSSSYNDNTTVPRKSRKRSPKQRPGFVRVDDEGSNMDVFDADSAKGPHYVLSQLISEGKNNARGSNGITEPQKTSLKKGPALTGHYPGKSEGKELKVLVQPETQHRARYLTEGSRGSVKDRTQQGFPTVKLEGYNEPVTLQIFVGNDSGRVKPHGFYQACRVTGRNTTPCKEVDIEGTTVIEVSLDPGNNMTLAVDCVGILKLRNADVEARIGVAGSKKKSTRARLVFRVNIIRADGSTLTLQTPSSSILCTQPAGAPEILKKSLHTCTVKGGDELFLIGKNFLKGTKVIFQESNSEENNPWKAEAEIDMELFHQNHLIVKVPPYHNLHITSPVSVGIYVVTNAGRSHEMQPFTFTPDPVSSSDVSVKKEIPVPPCSFEETMKASGMKVPGCSLEEADLPTTLLSPILPSVVIKKEATTPMDVVSNQTPSAAFEVQEVGAGQPPLEISSNVQASAPFSVSVSHQGGDTEQCQQIQPSMFPNTDTLTTVQKQDISQPCPFPASKCSSQLQNNEGLLQQTTQFHNAHILLDSREVQTREILQADAAKISLSQIPESARQQKHQHQKQQQQSTTQAQAQALQEHSPNLFQPSDSVSQLQNALHSMQQRNFQTNANSGRSDNVSLVHQALEASQQQLTSVLFTGSSTSETMQQPVEQVQDQINADLFHQVNSMQNSLTQGLFSNSDNTSLPRSDNVLSAPENSLSNQQVLETSTDILMEMQQNICPGSGQLQSDMYQSSKVMSAQGSLNGALQQGDIFQQSTHAVSSLQSSDENQHQISHSGIFSPAATVAGKENKGNPQQATSSPSVFQCSNSMVTVEETSVQSNQRQTNMFESIVQMQQSGDSQPQVTLFSNTDGMIHVKSGGSSQQSGIFQQGGEMLSMQPGNFLQQSHPSSELFHPQNSLNQVQSTSHSQESQSGLYHCSSTMLPHQNNAASQDQVQSTLFHPQNSMAVLQGSSIGQDQQQSTLFLSPNSLPPLQDSNMSQDKQPVNFYSPQSSIQALQSSGDPEQQSVNVFQTQTLMSQIQSTMIPQEQQHQQQSLFQHQVTMSSPQANTSPQNQQASMFQTQHSIATLHNNTSPQDQPQNVLFNSQNAISPINSSMTSQEQQQNVLFNSRSTVHSQSTVPPMNTNLASQEQQNQNLFHTQPNMVAVNQEQQSSMQFQNQTTVSTLQNSGTRQADEQQPSVFHSQPQMQLVQSSGDSQSQQVTLFISQTSMSALQNDINQQEMQQSTIFNPQSNLSVLQTTTSVPSQQQSTLFHPQGTMNQLQSTPAPAQQPTGLYLFGIQNDCGQLMNITNVSQPCPTGPSTLSDQLLAMSQPGQAPSEGQAVSTLLPQQLTDTRQLSSTITAEENMEKIDDILVTLQNQGSNISRSFNP